MNLKKRAYNGKEYILDEENQVVRLSKDYHLKLLNSTNKFECFKKFGGSSIGDIFLTDNFKSHFSAFCFIARLKMPALQLKYIKAGIELEPKVIEYLKSIWENETIEHIEASKVDYDYFKEQNIIGGVPDGLIKNKKIVLELKAVGAKKRKEWENENNNIPEDYKKQAQLYAHLLGYNHYMIVGTFLNENDYENTHLVDFKTQTQGFLFKVNHEQAKDDIKVIKEFWLKYTQLGISPQYRLDRSDNDLVNYLKCHNENEWKELFNLWKEQGKIDEEIKFE
ncbi:MAGa7180 family putative nuclease [Mycoplasma sp. 1018B]|uniref:MAGa7180 family putative nuclease n=1 Tax=Mycoplasma sp. 1018B TaxID=2967302 RepID=UPI00211C146F|nr:hypothetical protein [Mycoplasma sp. 1018B]UUM18997.1 hypothetical protein NPA14_01500 [Mycoplasma sp. 1018B]